MPLDYKTPKQRKACLLQGASKYSMLYGGSRSGKTFITVRNIILRAASKKSRHLIARRTFASVKTAVWMDTFAAVMSICFPNLQAKPNKTDWFYTLPNGSEIWFAGLDDKERVDKILGKEYSTIYVNEATEVSWDTIETLFSRLAENSGLPLRFFCDCNPASIKHWTYTVPIKGELESGEHYSGHNLWGVLQMNPQDNAANLPDGYIEETLANMSKNKRKRFLEGIFQSDIEGALWDMKMISDAIAKEHDIIEHTVIAVDPAVSHTEDSDETGIIVCARDANKHGIVIADLSIKASTQSWGQRVVNAYHEHKANCIVAEKNNGGTLIKDLIKSIDKNIPVHLVHAAQGKFARAEPVAALYEQGKIAHKESFHDLETELTEYVPLDAKYSPNRLDALVWGFDYLFLGLRGTKKATIAGPRMITA